MAWIMQAIPMALTMVPPGENFFGFSLPEITKKINRLFFAILEWPTPNVPHWWHPEIQLAPPIWQAIKPWLNCKLRGGEFTHGTINYKLWVG